MKAKSHFQNID